MTGAVTQLDNADKSLNPRMTFPSLRGRFAADDNIHDLGFSWL
jgi:hypothetical protein